MQPIIKFGPTKDFISSTLQTTVSYEPRSLRGISIFDPFLIQGTGIIAFLVKNYWNSTTSSPLLWANLSTLKL